MRNRTFTCPEHAAREFPRHSRHDQGPNGKGVRRRRAGASPFSESAQALLPERPPSRPLYRTGPNCGREGVATAACSPRTWTTGMSGASPPKPEGPKAPPAATPLRQRSSAPPARSSSTTSPSKSHSNRGRSLGRGRPPQHRHPAALGRFKAQRVPECLLRALATRPRWRIRPKPRAITTRRASVSLKKLEDAPPRG